MNVHHCHLAHYFKGHLFEGLTVVVIVIIINS